MKKKDTSKPLMLYLAESIYFQLIKIKESDPQITNIELVERFLATKEFNTIDLLNLQKNTVIKQFKENNEAYFAKSSFPLSNSQNAFGLVWRMCETYELWCKEIKKEKLIKLNFID